MHSDDKDDLDCQDEGEAIVEENDDEICIALEI